MIGFNNRCTAGCELYTFIVVFVTDAPQTAQQPPSSIYPVSCFPYSLSLSIPVVPGVSVSSLVCDVPARRPPIYHRVFYSRSLAQK